MNTADHLILTHGLVTILAGRLGVVRGYEVTPEELDVILVDVSNNFDSHYTLVSTAIVLSGSAVASDIEVSGAWNKVDDYLYRVEAECSII